VFDVFHSLSISDIEPSLLDRFPRHSGNVAISLTSSP
jgi:hypothetical protein